MKTREQAPVLQHRPRWFHWVPLTFPQRLLVLLLLAVVTPAALSVLAFGEIMRSYKEDRSTYNGRTLGEILATTLSGRVDGGWTRADRVLLDYLAADDTVAFICVVNAEGRPVHMSVHDSSAWDTYLASQRESYVRGYLDVTRRVSVSGSSDGLIVHAVPIHSPDQSDSVALGNPIEAEGYVVLGILDISFRAAARQYQTAQLITSGIVTVVIAPLILFAYRRWTGPLRQLRANVMKLADGKPPGPISLKHDDDIGRLCVAVDRMAGSVIAAQRQLRDANFNLEGLVKQRTIELREAVRELEQLSTTDVLTGLANRRAFYRQLEDDYARAAAYRGELSILMIDLDGFKQVNDSFGHDAGDEVLITVAEAIMSCCDGNMTPARLGGDEFVVLIRHVSVPECCAIAERMCETFAKLIASRLSRFANPPVVSMSQGLASLRESNARGGDELMAMADRALYGAKSGGRSRLVVFEQAMALARTDAPNDRERPSQQHAA